MNPELTLPEPPEFGARPRHPTRQVVVGKVAVGGDAPVVVQSMTNTDTADVASTTKQVAELWRAGSELVRVTVNTPEAAAAVPRIVEKLAMMGIDVPLIGDFHYNGHTLLADEPACAEALAKYRINPGNVGGIVIGHRLHHHRRIAADKHLADQDLARRVAPLRAEFGGLGQWQFGIHGRIVAAGILPRCPSMPPPTRS